MKIVLVEKGGVESGPSERTFEQPTIRIGRDAGNCDIVFSSENYRMVSRNHAELRWRDSSWVLVDNNSSFGTFVNGTRISQPTLISIGSSIQFGANGPLVHVIWIEEAESASNDQFQSSVPPPANPAPPPAPISSRNMETPVKQTPDKRPSARLELIGIQGGPPTEITKDSFWLGRDPQGDIVIEGSAVMVSRAHAEIRYQNGDFVVVDNNSFNGTLVNERRISSETPLYDNDRIQLGRGGPVLKFIAPGRTAPKESEIVGVGNAVPGVPHPASVGSATMVFNMGDVSQVRPGGETGAEQLLMQIGFDGKNELQIGRNESNDISLDGLQISNLHARLRNTGSGVVVEDLNSTNGVYINGERISRRTVSPADAIQIGSFVLKIDEYNNIGVFDTRSKIRIDSIGITKEVRNRAGGGKIRLLDDISLSIKPNEFIGLLGPSGAGKSTYMDALNGMRPPTSGSVLINNQDLYRYLDSLKQSIGYVPQDDIIHRELTVYKTLFYVAKLRLSRDVSKSEIDQIIEEVLDVTGLDERRDVPINELSGGQRKRVSIAVELITKPSIIFLDEPTSGLDPATEEKIMKLFRQIAESGRTVILTTHAMENVRL
ncbi:MAG: FHA domain-containing protein, partial [Acidobacteria bacterium]|nr:FHA domain-containing protein [Acidobacteriota bacterium]